MADDALTEKIELRVESPPVELPGIDAAIAVSEARNYLERGTAARTTFVSRTAHTIVLV